MTARGEWLLQRRTTAADGIETGGAQEHANVGAQGVRDGDEYTDADIGSRGLDALEKGQVNAGLFGELFLCQSSQCAAPSNVGGNVP